MTKRNLSIRLSAEGQKQLEAALRSVGKEGEEALRKVQRASEPASRGMLALDKAAGSLKARLTGLVAGLGVAAFATFTKGAIAQADALAKTADRIGITTAALQELRFAAGLAGVGQQELEAGLQQLSRRIGETAAGAGDAKATFEAMGIEVRDASGPVRAAEGVLRDLADRFQQIESPAQRAALAAKLFGEEGGARMAQFLAQGNDELDRTREKARQLGIVLDESLLRNAEKANDELDIMGQVLQARLSVAAVSLAPLIMDIAGAFGEVAYYTALAYEGFKPFLERGAMRLEYDLERAREELADLKHDLDMIDINAPIGKARGTVVREIAEQERLIHQIEARLAVLKGPVVPIVAAPSGPDLAAVQAETRTRIIADLTAEMARELEINRLAAAERERQAAADKAVADAKARLKREIGESATLTAEEEKAIRAAATASVQAKQATEAAAKATKDRAAEAKKLADELNKLVTADAVQQEKDREAASQRAQQVINDDIAEGKRVLEDTRTAAERYATEVARLTGLLKRGRIDQDTFNRAVRDADPAMQELGRAGERAFDRIGAGLTQMALEGEMSFDSLRNVGLAVVSELAQAFMSLAVVNPLKNMLFGPLGGSAPVLGDMGGILGSLFSPGGYSLSTGSAGAASSTMSSGLVVNWHHEGGIAGMDTGRRSRVPAALFAGAPRYHWGGLAGDEVPAILRRGEEVLTEADPRHVANGGRAGRAVIINQSFDFSGANPATAALLRTEAARIKAETLAAVGPLVEDRLLRGRRR